MSMRSRQRLLSGASHSQTQTKPKSSFTPVKSGLLQRKCSCGGSAGLTGECTGCQKNRLTVQRREKNQGEVSQVPPIVHEVLREPGQPLDRETRGFMESRFGQKLKQVRSPKAGSGIIYPQLTISQPGDTLEAEADQVAGAVMSQESETTLTESPLPDFSSVRVHNNTKAASAASSIHAEAFTLGNHIIFAEGRYQTDTNQGRHLLAHELTHYIQQQATKPQIQRKLLVNPNHTSLAPANDPAASLTSTQRLSMMDSLIQGLCDEFEVNSTTGEVQPKSLQSLDSTVLVTGSKPTGCCCLNILTNPLANNWTIEVSQVVGPQTDFSGHQVILSPTTTPVEFGSFTASGSLAFQGAVPAAGHELCGHAALEEISAHPPDQDRTTTDVHDPTVRIENLISSEQGVPSSDLRGLASEPHRGESVDRITIRNYQFNATNVPTSEQSKIQFAANYIRTNDSFVDILGHSDNVGSPTAKQHVSQQRADMVKTALTNRGVSTQITKFNLTNVNRFTRVEGLSDTQPPPPPLQSNQDNWRRVDILMAGFPAGAQNPPLGTSTVVNPHVQSPNVSTLRSSTDPCIRHLVRGGYP
ncbi:DUF4157 domain-containing protein [Brasilonema sp. UFV-L1]|uniref:eCIS core domain-containing protein n=1 Tax=Brasilonema sp. UFV-L1 TaxID=2234130 RepID=UPI00145F194C|nr:DUF4157 domain-containing protein [Brasilonema sp. UFV-L1]NMG11603.1 hypothetical protein [Brasilonema sp. UFV-L1]